MSSKWVRGLFRGLLVFLSIILYLRFIPDLSVWLDAIFLSIIVYGVTKFYDMIFEKIGRASCRERV